MIYGIDIGGSKIEIAVFDQQLNRLDNWRVATPQTSYIDFLAQIVNLVTQADIRFNARGQVGIGMPGIINAKQQVLSANIPSATGHNAAADLSRLLERLVTVENDCRCFALSEASLGAGARYSRVFGAIIGTGAGGGLCINGQLYKSAQGIAGEYGHYPLAATLQQKYNLPIEPCGCGLSGCLERYISGPGLAHIHFCLFGEKLTSIDVIRNMRDDDKNCISSFSCYMDVLGSAFANIIMSYDPQAIILGGGMSLVDEVIEQLPAAILPHVFNDIVVPDILRAEHGDASGALGAAIIGQRTSEFYHE
jgi:N-acetylglucosamine kinase